MHAPAPRIATLVAAVGLVFASGGSAAEQALSAFADTGVAFGIEPIAYHNYYWLEQPCTDTPGVSVAPKSLPTPTAEEPLAVGDSHADDFSARLAALEQKYANLDHAHGSLETAVMDQLRPRSNGSTMQTSGRMHVDVWGFPGDSPGVNGFETGDNALSPQDQITFRRLRFGIGGTVWKTMVYEIDVEFADASNAEFRDAYFGFRDVPWLQKVLIGYQKRPYSLDQLNSSNHNVFMERPFMAEAFNRDVRRLGIQSWNVSDDLAWNWRYGVFNQARIQGNGTYTSDHWQAQLAGRLANTVWYDHCSNGRGYAHWALSGTWADTDGNATTLNYAGSGRNAARFTTRPEARTFSLWLDTDVIDGAVDYTLLGVENVVNVGALQFVGEYQHVWVDRDANSQLEFQGGYLYVSYFLTGEHIPWDRETGTIGRVHPFENFFVVDTCRDGVRCGWGAWQVAARYSLADLSDNDILGGIGESFTAGVNWHWNPWARMQFNYIYGNIWDNAENAAGGIDFGDYHILGARFMVDF